MNAANGTQSSSHCRPPNPINHRHWHRQTQDLRPFQGQSCPWWGNLFAAIERLEQSPFPCFCRTNWRNNFQQNWSKQAIQSSLFCHQNPNLTQKPQEKRVNWPPQYSADNCCLEPLSRTAFECHHWSKNSNFRRKCCQKVRLCRRHCPHQKS